MEHNSMDVPQMIKTARENNNLTQTQVAEKMDLGLRMYQKIEGGSFPKFKTEQIKKLDLILNSNFYELIYSQKCDEKFNISQISNTSEYKEQPIPLTKEKICYLKYPSNLTAKDVEIISKALEMIQAGLDK